MEPDRLAALLRQAVREGPREPVSPDCLGTSAIVALLESEDGARPEDLQHVSHCGYCQGALALAWRERDLLTAPWEGEQRDRAVSCGDADVAACANKATSSMRTIRFDRRIAGLSAVAGIAAVVVLAVTLGWRSTGRPDLLGPIAGRFAPGDVTRDHRRPEKQYRISIELREAAYLTFLYLDSEPRHQLQLPANATGHAERYGAGAHADAFHVNVTDDQPGPQWIAAVASRQPFDPLVLREKLQAAIDALPDGKSFEEMVAALETALEKRREFCFLDHRFEVGTPGPELPVVEPLPELRGREAGER